MFVNSQNKGPEITQGLHQERKYDNNNMYNCMGSIDNFNDNRRHGRMNLNHIGTHKTTVTGYQIRHNNKLNYSTTKVCYQNTIVCEFDDKIIKLNTGGWFTSTTKRRMNQASQEFNLGYYIYQKNYVWYCKYNNKIFSFTGNYLNLPIAH